MIYWPAAHWPISRKIQRAPKLVELNWILRAIYVIETGEEMALKTMSIDKLVKLKEEAALDSKITEQRRARLK